MKYNKLVRDNIPAIIAKDNKTVTFKAASEIEKKNHLRSKLIEEVEEFLLDDNLEELADIFEVIVAIAEAKGFSEVELLNKRYEKKNKNGGFKEGYILIEVKEGE